MALAPRSKPNVHQKKRQARHHRQSKQYMKSYWPYLPMLAIVGLGYIVNNAWAGSLESQAVDAQFAAANLTRIEAMTGKQATLSLTVVCFLAAAAFAVFIFRHWHRLNLMLRKGESLLIHHPWFDTLLVFTFTAGAILTRTN